MSKVEPIVRHIFDLPTQERAAAILQRLQTDPQHTAQALELIFQYLRRLEDVHLAASVLFSGIPGDEDPTIRAKTLVTASLAVGKPWDVMPVVED